PAMPSTSAASKTDAVRMTTRAARLYQGRGAAGGCKSRRTLPTPALAPVTPPGLVPPPNRGLPGPVLLPGHVPPGPVPPGPGPAGRVPLWSGPGAPLVAGPPAGGPPRCGVVRLLPIRCTASTYRTSRNHGFGWVTREFHLYPTI